MPHKVTTVDLLDEASTAVKVAGSCNAVRKSREGRLQGDLYDGEGFVRGIRRKGFQVEGARALVVGSGGVGCAIAASLRSLRRIASMSAKSSAASGIGKRAGGENGPLKAR